MSIGSISLLVALAGFLVLVGYLFKTRNESWASWAASMPLSDDAPSTHVSPGTEESA